MQRPRADKGPEHGPCRARAVAGYIRVSSPSQDYAYQRHAIEQAARARGELVAHWFGDVASGRSMDRPELQRMLASLDAGAISRVWVWRLDRLTRSGIADTLEVVEHIRSRATLASVADGFALDEGPAAELVLAVLAWAARVEREKIRENQAAARERLERQGRTWGRPRIPPEIRDECRSRLSRGYTIREIARSLKISRSSVAKIGREKPAVI